MADHNEVPGEAQHSHPDYDLPETLALEDPAQYRALFEETRAQIVELLRERAATTSELAEALDKPKGTVGHHLKVLERAGLVRVVRTVRVRALEAKYYGRTARTFLYERVGEAAGAEQRTMAQAAAAMAALPPDTEDFWAVAKHARIPVARAAEWAQRLNELVVEFWDQPKEGDATYTLVMGLYPTRRPALPEQSEEESDERPDEGTKP